MKNPPTYSSFSRLGNEKLRMELEQERASFIPSWRDCGDYVLPRRPRFFVSDANKGDRRNQKIIDSTATLALETMSAGMMSGVSSPARPWFRITTPDKDLANLTNVKLWLQGVTDRMSSVFTQSNLYNILPIVYADLGCFGTAAMMIETDERRIVRFKSFPIGSYCIAQNSAGVVDTFVREFRMTVAQLIEEFGKQAGETEINWDRFSNQVKSLYEQEQYQAWVDICHVIRPNTEYNAKKFDSRNKKYASCYYEKGTAVANALSGDDQDKVLSEKGYDYFPVFCPRWAVTGEDVYATGWPVLNALGDIKALQVMQKRKAQGVAKMVNPPMIGPSSLRGVKASLIEGDITYYDEREGTKGFRPVHEVQMPIGELREDIQETSFRIKRALFESLFLMFAGSDRRDITAREIDARQEEKLLALGPVLEQLNQDLYDKLVDATFHEMLVADRIPEPPQEIQGTELRVEYISIMAQAQKMVGISGIERFMQFVVGSAPVVPQILQKIDGHKLADVYGDSLSLPPGVIRSDEDAQALADAEAKAQQQAQANEAMMGATQAARNLSGASLEGNNALTALIGAEPPYPGQ